MKKLHLILITIILISNFSLFANETMPHNDKTEIFGHVVDQRSGEYLGYATIQIKGTTIGTVSDVSGHFILNNIPEGEQTLVIKLLGYKTEEKKVNLKVGKKEDVIIFLKEDAVELNSVVVTSSRMETSRKEASSIVNVVSPRIFELTNSNVISEGLCFTPGLRVDNNCQNCGFQQVRINGLDGQYSQILIDGRPVISALGGVYGIEQIPIGMVDRVEVLRGGGSALYGSNAIAGTVNIITKEPVKNSESISHSFRMIDGKASENNTNINASLVSDDYKAGVYFFGNLRSRASLDYDNDGFTELSKLNASTVGFRGYYKTSDFSKLTVEYHNIWEFRRGGDSLDRQPHESNICEQTDHKINGGGLTFDLFSKNYKQKITLYASAQYTDRASYYGAERDPNAYGASEDLTFDAGGYYSYSFNKLWFMPAQFIAGIEYNYDHLVDEVLGYHREINQITRMGSIFLQNEWKNNKWSVLLGGRLDKHNMIEHSVFSPRVNLRYSPIENIGIRVSYAEGFRAPQAFSEDLHIAIINGEGTLIVVDPDLKPERSRSVSGSVDLYKAFANVQTNLMIEGFYSNLRDVFILESAVVDDRGNVVHYKSNGSGAIVRGITLEGKIAFSRRYQLQAGFTVQKSSYKKPEAWSDDPEVETATNLFRSPGCYGYFTASLNFWKELTLALSGIYTGSMYMEHFAGYIEQDRIEKTPGFFDMNCKLSYMFNLKGSTGLQLNAGIENIFNSYQKDFDQGPDRDSGYIYGPIYPRSWFVGLKFML
ncbi:MAG: TonB-dependent receptor [Bacteroidales bacterium]|jgi:outer membrane receptor for ferrienterochelin and colicins|nr:TonB-dependent receptor [Bacteroidales bacterium]